jgi:phosphatidylglycerophosphatase C
MELALFDFDGTITVKDSTTDFIKFSCGRLKSAAGFILLCPLMAAYLLGLVSSHRTKQAFFTFYFKNRDFAGFQKLADEYCDTVIPALIRPKALERIRWHKENNHHVVVVSGACVNWLQKWCDGLGVDLIATQIEVSDGKLTGKLATRNCYGREKARRITAQYDLGRFERIHAYGDSKGDRAMLALADEGYYRFFNDRRPKRLVRSSPSII